MMKLKFFRGGVLGGMVVALVFSVGCAQNPYAVGVESVGVESAGQDSPSIDGQVSPEIEKSTISSSPDARQKPQPQLNSKPRSAPKSYKANPAVLALMDRARMSGDNGDYQSAEVSLERALRINPKNLKLYRLMVELKIQKGDRQSAVEIARKGLSIAKGGRQREEKRLLEALLEQVSL